MIPLISLMFIILFSIIVVRIGAVALEMTGLSREIARFQAQSAFSGTGFTTTESEHVVSHPTRRKIIRILIFIGNAGIISVIATLLLTFIGQTQEEATMTLMWLFLGLFILFLFGRSKIIDRGLRWIIKKGLESFTNLKVYDYEELLGISKGYSIGEFTVRKGSWLENKELGDLKLNEEGVIVLAIYKKIRGRERFIGAPPEDTKVVKGDILVCYGLEDTIRNLSERLKGAAGDKQHREAVEKERIAREQQGEELLRFGVRTKGGGG